MGAFSMRGGHFFTSLSALLFFFSKKSGHFIGPMMLILAINTVEADTLSALSEHIVRGRTDRGGIYNIPLSAWMSA